MLKASDWRDTFCGRQVELKRLIGAYDAVEKGNGPQLAIVCADRGMGKTRLVQEFYRFLTTERDPTNYWPDASLFKGNNLRVAPDFSDPNIQAHFASFTNAQRPMPFLWWGFRLHDPTDRNAVRSDMAGHRRTLDPHLERVRQVRNLATTRAEATQAAKDTAKDAAFKIGEGLLDSIPGVSLAKSIVEVGFGVAKTAKLQAAVRRKEALFAKSDLAQVEEQRAQDIYESTLEDLAAVMSSKDGTAGTPAIVFCDDAQFARVDGDEGALRFLDQLWHRAKHGQWPLLLVATHWAADWDQDREAENLSFAKTFDQVALDETRGVMVCLSKQSDLRALAKSGLPTMPANDVGLVLRKADGNPQILIELIGRVHSSPAWRTRDGALSPLGRMKIEDHSCRLTQLIYERLISDATPPEVRLAVALSSLQGMRFLCPVTEAAANAMHLGTVGSGISEAAHPLRLIVGVEAGVASFVQRAYRDASYSLVESHLGDPIAVKGELLGAAIGLVRSEPCWSALAPDQQRALLGVVASLGAESDDPGQRTEAARSLVRLIELEEDSAGRAQHARAFADGLGRLWNAASLSDAQIRGVIEALEQWDGPLASYAFESKLLDEFRQTHKASPVDHLRRLFVALDLMTLHEARLDEYDKAAKLVQEKIELSRAAVSTAAMSEVDLAENLLGAAGWHSPIVPPDVASRWGDEAIEILRRRFLHELSIDTCTSFIEGLETVSAQLGVSNDSRGAETLLREAVESAKLLRAQPTAESDRHRVAALCMRALCSYLEPKVRTSDGRFRLALGEDASELLPHFVELINVASELHAASAAPLADALVAFSTCAALLAVRLGDNALAATSFERCSLFIDAPDLKPSTRSLALWSAALERLSRQDLAGSKAYAAKAVRVTRESRCWELHYEALAFESRLDRLDLAILLEPDPEDIDIASALLPALRAIREDVVTSGITDEGAIEVFALIRKWLSNEASTDALDVTDIRACVAQVQLLCAELRVRPANRRLTLSGRAEWLLAVLATLTLGSRALPAEQLHDLWELAQALLSAMRPEEHAVDRLQEVAGSLSDLGSTSGSFAAHGAAVDLTRVLAARTGDPWHRRDLAFRLNLLALEYIGEGEFARPRELLDEAFAIASEQASQAESVNSLSELKRVLDSLELLSSRAGDLLQASEHRIQRAEILRRIVRISNGEEGQEELTELIDSSVGDSSRPVLLH